MSKVQTAYAVRMETRNGVLETRAYLLIIFELVRLCFVRVTVSARELIKRFHESSSMASTHRSRTSIFIQCKCSKEI